MNAYTIIIACSLIVIISFVFNWVADKTNIPSVLMLIGLGIGIQFLARKQGINEKELGLDAILEILGNVGLVFIVLEAALDLKLERKKLRLLVQSFATATLGFAGSMFAIGYFFQLIYPESSFYTCLIYAAPLSIMSSAIIIPSVGSLRGKKREFMVYESTFSDIIGIMVFYFMMGAEGSNNAQEVGSEIVLNILATVALSVIASFLLVFVIQRLTMQVKLFLIVAVLMLLFAIGKSFHLSSLLLILVFGLLLNNTKVFFRGRIANYFQHDTVERILHDFHTLILESAFLIRTFFFVVFGFSITLSSLYSWQIALYGGIITLIFYVVRLTVLGTIARKHILPEIWIAPRGLITILLFFSIQKSKGFVIHGFDTGLLLYPIFITSIIMTLGLLTHKGTKLSEAVIQQLPRLPKSKDQS